MVELDRALRDIERRLRRDVEAKIDELGVPTDTDAVYDITVELHPIVAEYRAEAYRVYVEQMGSDMSGLGLEVAPAPMRSYDAHATYDAVARAAGFGEKPSNIVLEMVDDETKELIKKSVPAFAFPDHPRVVEQLTGRLVRSLKRHVLNAGRNAVEDTAKLGRVRDASSKKPAGRRVGYARVLTGRESCPFCAMLASRGPVYSEDTVTRRKDGRRYHDGCDCRAVLVVEGKPWNGQAAYEKLEAQWNQVAGDLTGYDQWKAWQHSYRGTVPGIDLRLPRRGGKLMASAPYFDDEPLPRLPDLVKHSVWGWRRGDEPITSRTPRIGHTFDSVRMKGTFFPERWSDRDIADAIAATVEDPDLTKKKGNRRFVLKEIDGVYVEVVWDAIDERAKAYSAYPIFGDGVERYIGNQRVAYDKPDERSLRKYD